MIDGRKLKALADNHSPKVTAAQIAVILGYETTDSAYKVFRNEIHVKDPRKVRELAELVGVHPREILMDSLVDLVMGEDNEVYDAGYRVPIVGKIAAADSEPLIFDDAGFPTGYGPFGSVNMTQLGAGAYSVLTDGDSMVPRFMPGEPLVIDPLAAFQSGKYYVIIAKDGRKWAKRVIKKGEKYTLVPENPLYDPIELTQDEIAHIHRIRFVELR